MHYALFGGSLGALLERLNIVYMNYCQNPPLSRETAAHVRFQPLVAKLSLEEKMRLTTLLVLWTTAGRVEFSL